MSQPRATSDEHDSDTAAPAAHDLPQAELRIDQIAESFERAWREKGSPTIDAFLKTQHADRRQLLCELIRVDLEQRMRAGESIRVEAYLSCYDELSVDAEQVLELLAWEYRLRRMLGEQVTIEEYSRRFPERADELRRRLSEPAAEVPRQAVRLNCPHCHNPIEIVAAGDEELVCPSCGSNFHLDPLATRTWEKQRLPKLGKFELQGQLGVGAFGAVYKGFDTELRRTVAVKLPRSGMIVDSSDEERFLREARNAAQLRHPGIVPVYEVGRSEQFSFIVSELVEGITLADALTGRRFTFRQAADLVKQMAEALEYSHRHGVVHRDLKPSNVMLAADGKARIMDFGLAKRDAGEVTVTIDGQVLGTPAYMSPEQAAGRAHQVDGRSDVYSLGAILYELITAELPFRGNQRMLLHQVLHDEPRAPRSLNDRIPRDLETVCIKAMAKEPARRYPTAAAMAEDLGRFLAGHPVLARPVGRAERAWRWCRRNPTVAWLSGSVAILLVAIATGASIAALVLGLQKKQLSEQTVQLRDAEQIAIENLWQAYHAQAKAARWSRRPGQRVQSLRAAASAGALIPRLNVRPSDVLDLRNEAIASMPLVDLSVAREWDFASRYTSAFNYAIDADPPLERVAIADSQGTTRIVRLDDHSEMLTIPLPGDAPPGSKTMPRFSRDGQYLALRVGPATGLCDLHVWDLERRELVFKLKESLYREAIDFHPNGKVIATARDDGTIVLCHLPTGDELKRINTRLLAPFAIAFRPDGEVFAISSEQGGGVEVRLLEQGQLLYRTSRAANFALAWSPDGKLLATTGADFRVNVLELSEQQSRLMTLQSRVVLEGHDAEPTRVAFSHDGEILASTGWDGRTIFWDPFKGRELLSTAGMFDRFGPDDKQLSFHSQVSVGVWDVARGDEYRSIGEHTGYKNPWDVAFSPDDRWLVSTGTDGVRFWNTQTGQELIQIDKKGGHGVLVSRDGGKLFTSGGSGLHQWSIITVDHQAVTEVHVGPPDPILVGGDSGRVAGTADGRMLGVYDRSGRITILRYHAGEPLQLPGIEPARSEPNVALHPDGNLVAAGTWDTSVVKVWNTGSGELVKELESGLGTHVAFSPDGQLFAAVSRQGVRVWNVGSWTPVVTLAHTRAGIATGCVDFAPKTGLLAAAYPDRMIQLIDTASGQRVALLEAPDRVMLRSLKFNSDGTKLAAATEGDIVHLWDLRRVRERLSELNLDWDAPPFPPAKDPSTKPLRVTIIPDQPKP